jgi:hypothetical protein
MAVKVDPLFKRNAAAEKRAMERLGLTQEEIDARGGVSAAGYYGDSWNPETSLTDEEYAAASAGKTGEALGAALNAAVAAKKTKTNVTKSAGDTTTYTADDGTVFTDQAAFTAYQAGIREAKMAKEAIAAEDLSKRQSAYDLLYNEFAQYGLSDLVEPLKGFIQSGISPAEFTLRLRETPAYQTRFAANADRVKKGLAAITEAEYIGLEDQYQNIMRNYGLPESYYAKGQYGTQAGLQSFIANDVSATELEDRVLTAQQRVVNSNPEVLASLKAFYPDITNGDILAYTLDPTNALDAIKRKVTAAEIGGAATQAGLTAGLTRADELAKAGITKQQAQQGFQTVAEIAPRGGQLAAMYGESPYTQQTAEQEVFGLAGSVDAAKQRKKLSGLEQASFSGQSGTAQGALGRERAGNF